MIKLEHISKWVNQGNNRIFLLKDINISIAEGEFVSIMGPSGSGKSTLLNVIGMLDTADEGAYFLMINRYIPSRKNNDRSCINNISALFSRPTISLMS
ncbi:ATP-binding cassette domain-containing protein [Flavihumibacter sp. CACIAM 22H1]|uniref:ATP-binding cassette domain-containing protein n=1 Tax=Flavihumibacter sp. CACIAM 22H1 TaxID=1812911 RepID=UPI000A8C1D12|nr:ATP-binding cassette domain-containing protein [Flavihumibacter sp. CACIAM 22H1]